MSDEAESFGVGVEGADIRVDLAHRSAGLGSDRTLTGTVRERRYNDTLREIKAVAIGQLAESGATKLSLRAVAREVGMTVQSLYHYVDSYDALITLLVTDSYTEFADVVDTVARRTRGGYTDRIAAVTGEYRQWAVDNRAKFLLIYGTPIPGYQAPMTVAEPILRQANTFLDVLFGDWTADELRRIAGGPQKPADLVMYHDAIETSLAIAPLTARIVALPPGALSLFLQLRGTMHGLVMLEVMDHLHPLPAGGELLMRDFATRTAAELTRWRTG